MYYESRQQVIENKPILEAFKKLFGLCDNVDIVLLTDQDCPPLESYCLQMCVDNGMGHPVNYNVYHLQNVCSNIGVKMKEALLQRCKSYPFKDTKTLASRNIGHMIFFDQCYRYKDQVGLIGCVETYYSVLEKLSKTGNGDYHQTLNGSNFMPFDKEDDLYMFKGRPRFYLKCRTEKSKQSYQSINKISFGFYLEMSNIEIYKV